MPPLCVCGALRRVLNYVLDYWNVLLLHFAEVLLSYHGLVISLAVDGLSYYPGLLLDTLIEESRHCNSFPLWLHRLYFPTKLSQESSLRSVDHRGEEVIIHRVAIGACAFA